MNQNFLDFQTKFKVNELKVYESEYWTWSVRPVHCTLGAGVLSLKRHCENMSGITLAESEDMGRIVKVIENTLKATFSYNRLNYLMLMMVDFHLHFHVLPRYSSEQIFNGKSFIDIGWPKLPELTAPQLEVEIIHQIRDTLVENLKL